MKVDERIRLAHFVGKTGSRIRIFAVLNPFTQSLLSNRFQVVSSSIRTDGPFAIRQNFHLCFPSLMALLSTREQLQILSRNLWWSWHPEALSLFKRLNRDALKASGNNPLVALNLAKYDVLNDTQVQAEVDAVYRQFTEYMEATGGQEAAPKTAYFCMEYGLHESLPLYSGGLGILAGDHTKAASDVGLPLTAVGLFLRDGYFRQYFDDEGVLHDDYPAID